jgi:hypothetical protein
MIVGILIAQRPLPDGVRLPGTRANSARGRPFERTTGPKITFLERRGRVLGCSETERLRSTNATQLRQILTLAEI